MLLSAGQYMKEAGADPTGLYIIPTVVQGSPQDESTRVVPMKKSKQNFGLAHAFNHIKANCYQSGAAPL